MKNWRKVLLQALFYFCGFMAIIWLLNMVFSDGIDDWKGEIIKGSLYTVTKKSIYGNDVEPSDKEFARFKKIKYK